MTESSPTTAGPPATTLLPSRPDDRVPADERVLGFDRRTIWPGVVLLVVWALWGHAMPWLDRQIEVDNPIAAGDVANLGAGEVTFVPAVGWDLESGVLLTDGDEDAASVPSSVLLSSGVVSYGAKSGNWDGTTGELADRMIDVNDSLQQLVARDEQGRSAIQNADGVPGELVYVLGVDQAVLVVTFVFEREDSGSAADIGVEIEVRGTPSSLKDQVRDIATMIETTTYRPAGQEATP